MMVSPNKNDSSHRLPMYIVHHVKID